MSSPNAVAASGVSVTQPLIEHRLDELAGVLALAILQALPDNAEPGPRTDQPLQFARAASRRPA